jgi:ankyrin repeat protein
MKRKLIVAGALLFLHFFVLGQSNAALLDFVEKGSLEEARTELQRAPLANSFRNDYVSLLSIALQRKNRPMAQLIIDHGANLYTWTGAGSPLKYCGDVEICEWFKSIRNAVERMAKAANDGDIPTIQATVAQGFSPDLADSLNGRPLYIAAKKGNLEMVRALLKLGAKASLAWEENKAFSPLHAAAQEGHLEVARILIQNGADLNARFANGAMPLHLALHANHPEIAVLLIESGANLEAPLHTAGFPIILAAQFRNKKILDLLIQKGATKPKEPSDQEYLLKALANFGDVALFKYYVDKLGLDPQLPLRERMSHEANPLVTAAAHDSLPLVKYMVEELHYDVNRISWGESPLSVACRLGHLEIVRYLLDKGADVDEQVNASNALGRAVMACRTDILELLLRRGAKIRAVNGINHPMQLACMVDCIEGAKILLRYGADPEEGDCAQWKGNETQNYIQSSQNRIADVFRAMKSKDYATVESFLKVSRNPNATHEGHSLLEAAAANGDLAGINLMFRYGADVNFVPENGYAPLIAAITAPNCVPAIKALIAKGAEVTPKDLKSWSPLSWAAMMGPPEAVQTLLEAGADPNHYGIDRRPAWFSALAEGHARSLQWMLKNGADLKLEDEYGRNALFHCSNNDSLLRFLLGLPGIVVQDTDKFGLNILAYLQPHISIEALEMILQHPIDVNASNFQIRMGVAEAASKWKQMPEKVDLLRQHGFDVEAELPMQSSFYLAAYNNNPAEFRRLIDQFHPPFDVKNPVYGPSLWQACIRKRDVTGLKFLLSRGLTIDARDHRGASLLQFAYTHGYAGQNRDSILQTILSYNPKLDITDSLGHTVLISAMQQGDIKWAQYFVIHGADPNKADRAGYTPLLHLGYAWAILDQTLPSGESNLALAKWMIRNGANPEKKGLDGNTFLISACARNDLPLAQYLIDTLKFQVNDTTKAGESAFTKAVNEPQMKIGMDPEWPDIPGDDPLMWLEARIPLVRYLISKGANVNAMNRYLGYEPVVMIYQYGYTDFAKECVEAGYKINRVTTARNLFQSAVMQKDYNFVKYLLGKGLDPNLHFNGMPLERAVTDPKMLEILQGR